MATGVAAKAGFLRALRHPACLDVGGAERGEYLDARMPVTPEQESRIPAAVTAAGLGSFSLYPPMSGADVWRVEFEGGWVAEGHLHSDVDGLTIYANRSLILERSAGGCR